MKLSKLSGLVAVLLSNAAIAESYQSFTTLSYSKTDYSFNTPKNIYYSKGDSSSVGLYSQYFFDEKQTLGPLNEFNYINTSSNFSASINSLDSNGFSSYDAQESSSDSSVKNVSVGGEWITHNVILGASYSHYQFETKAPAYTIDYNDNDNIYSATLGYLVSDDFVIRANYNDGGDGDDSFSYSASYNLQLVDTDYIGFSYNVDEDFDIHNLSSRYFFGFAEQSYLVVGGNYTLDNSDNFFADDYWSANASYYYDDKTSVSVSYADNDFYSVGARYFINNNYSIQAGYNSVSGDKNQGESEGYHFSFSAQF
ncbi:hypothetical protein CXF85_09565 [Colwellia sp. 75C3]|uniref:putative porin n=1 Tax=Colwellia sp. 75C3 TaxID=888425 RepID=UPI000C333A1C|nr:putative porin [Colwellia sp. 75C3]PKG83746.1 hypothetical protein CXF85_09565 [Colwellia sp. 75C3]